MVFLLHLTQNPKVFQLIPLLFGSIAVLLTILVFSVPAIVEFEDHQSILNSSTIKAITGQPYRYVLLVSLGMLVPFSTDHIFAIPSLLRFDVLFRLESYLLPLLVVIMQSFNIYFLSQTAETVNYFWTYYMGTYIQLIVLYNSVLAIQANLAQKSLDVIIAVAISSFTMNLGIVVKLFALVKQDDQSLQQISWFTLFGIATLSNLYIARYWLLKYNLSQKTGLKNQPDIYAFCKIVSLCAFLVAYNLEDIIDGKHHGGTLLNDHDGHVAIVQGLLIGFFFLISEISYRRTKDLARFSVEALETKRSFVRYVSHEIRTPLNTACLGMQLLDKEVQKLFAKRKNSKTLHDSKEEKKMKGALVELVADTHQACNVAVEILNDLLTYEKIDGGLMVLDANEILVWPFLNEVLKMFVVQAKASSLDLIWKTSVTNDVFITADSYKMSQVIRNLISNALKFSKPDGKVIVSAEIITKANPFRKSMQYGFNSSLRETESLNGSVHAATKRISFKPASRGSMEEDGDTPNIAQRLPTEFFTRQSLHVENVNENSRSMSGHVDEELMRNIWDPSILQYPPDAQQGASILEKGKSAGGSSLITNKTLAATSADSSVAGTSSIMLDSASSTGTSLYHHFFPFANQKKEKGFQSLSNINLSSHGGHSSINGHDSSSFHQNTDVIRISVKDDGAGISKENQKRLFNEIVQFDAAKLQQGKGSGIGLWISNKIMKLHGGLIGVYSEGEGNGSTFYIDIPITRTNVRRHRPNDIYYQELAQGISLVHTTPSTYELNENDHPGGGDTSSANDGELHREQSAGSATFDAHYVSSIVKKKPFTSLSSSFMSMIAHNVFGSSSSSTTGGGQQQSSKSARDVNVNGILSRHKHRNPSRVGVLDTLEAGPYTSLVNGEQNNPDEVIESALLPPSPSVISSRTKRLTSLLVVDDSAVNRKMLKRSLMDVVDHIEEAINGVDCVNKVKNAMKSSFGEGKGYDIIITDYFMPEMNGLEAAKQLRAHGYKGKIVGLTGNTDTSMIESFKKAGVNLVLTKPFQGADLHALISNLLNEIIEQDESIDNTETVV